MYFTMQNIVAILVLAIMAFGTVPANTVGGTLAKQKQPPLAGWLGIFPSLGGYARTFKAAVVEDDKNGPVYSQTVEYAWMGGADRHLTITVARDAKFKKLYSD